MNRYYILIAIMFLLSLITTSCSGGDGNPLTPSSPGLTVEAGHAGQSQTHLWGYYDVYVNVEDEVVEMVYDRTAMFTVNTVNFLQSGPDSFMTFAINNLLLTPDYLDIDIDVTLTHPFPGLPQFNGYDVRGIFMGDGSATLESQSDLIYPVFGTDQFMFGDPNSPYGENGAPDGYTRWFNISEFADPEMLLFGYIPGDLAPVDFAGTATLCPYKYFADGLGKDNVLCTWLEDNPGTHGQFSSGATNTRNYYLRFPNETGVMFGYAVMACWDGPGAESHPGNAPEAIACAVDDQNTLYFENSANNGGDLIFDIDFFGWEYQPSTIFVESTVLSSMYELTGSEMIPTGGGDNYSTYHVEIAADNITSDLGNEYWLIARYDGFDYTNAYDVLNDAWEDPLMSCFRFDLSLGETRTNVYVDGDNNTGIEEGTTAHPYNTIMEAINAAPAFSLIHVDALEASPGYYEEAVSLKTDVWLHGDNWNGGVGKPRIHINGVGGLHAVVPHMEAMNVSLIEVDGFELTSNHFEIEWWGSSTGNARFQLFYIRDSEDITVRNCLFHTSVSATGLTALRIVQSDNVTIEHNEIVDMFNTRDYNWSCWTAGIYCRDVDDLHIKQNEIHHLNHQNTHNANDAFITYTYGINCYFCENGLEITNNLIYDIYDYSEGDASHPQPNYYRSNVISGIFTHGCLNMIVTNNTCDDFNPVARSGSQAGRAYGYYTASGGSPAEFVTVNNNLMSNIVATELTSQSMFYGAGFYSAYDLTVDYSNVYNLDLTNGGAGYLGMAVMGTGSYDVSDNQDPNYDMTPGPTYYHVGNPVLLSDDGTEMGAFGGPEGNWIPPSQE